MSLIELGSFMLHSGKHTDFLICAEALDNETLHAIAALYADRYEYGKVWGVPNGGMRFAAALADYAVEDSDRVLVADDVYTTGRSMRELRDMLIMNEYDIDNIQGVVLFNRSYRQPAEWVTPIFDLNIAFCDEPEGDEYESDSD